MAEQADSRVATDLTRRGRGSAVLAVGAILLLAACLRPSITSVGPVLDQIGHGTGLGTGALGLLAALPPLAFAVMSPFTHAIATRFSIDRTLLAALGLLIVGIVVRSLPGTGLLWVGTVLLGFGIAVGNVLVPAVVKRDLAAHVSRMTGAYTSTMNAFAAIASGLAVPIAAWAIGGWRTALGIWSVLGLIALVIWGLRMRLLPTPPVAAPAIGTAAGQPVVPAGRRPPIWRSALAWQVTLHMGVQSTVFYTLVNWLPSLETQSGVPAAVAGTHLFVYQAVGIGAALAMIAVMGRRADQRLAASLLTVPMVIGLVGLLVAPGAAVLWIALAGVTSGGSIAMALALIGLRARDAVDTSRLSGMAQGFGYLLAASGPVVAGALRASTGGWQAVIVMLLGLTVAQGILGALAGRDRYVGDPSHHGSSSRRG
jgi:CP family cyanate transporter-like MFS transporter